MIKYIEDEYKEANRVNILNRVYWSGVITISVILLILYYILKVNYFTIWIIFIPSLLILSIISFKKYIGYSKISDNILNNIGVCIKKMNENDIKILVKILKSQHIKSREEIKILIDYFINRLPISTKTSSIQLFFTTIISLMTFIVVFIDDSTNVFDFEKFIFVFGFVIIYIVCYVVYLIIKSIFIKISNEELHLELIDALIYIYINFDECFYKNKLKTKNIFRKLKTLLN